MPRHESRDEHAERQQNLRVLLAILRRARQQHAEWYDWVLDYWRPYRLGQISISDLYPDERQERLM